MGIIGKITKDMYRDNTPSMSFLIAATKMNLDDKLESFPDILKEVGFYKNNFLNWAARNHLCEQVDMHEIFEEYKKNHPLNRRMESVDVVLYSAIRSMFFARDNYTCQYCGKVGGPLELEHKIPKSKCGTYTWENLCTSCQTCNRSKHDKDVNQFNEWKLNKIKQQHNKKGRKVRERN